MAQAQQFADQVESFFSALRMEQGKVTIPVGFDAEGAGEDGAEGQAS